MKVESLKFIICSYILVLVFIVSDLTKSNAQDIHFSQFDLTTINLNPALTGSFDGMYRFTGIQRRQWSSVTVPYQTFGLSAEAKKPLATLPALSGGLAIYNDKAGDSDFSTLKIDLSGAYSKAINTDSTQFIKGGLQFGFTQRNINFNNLTFDRQFDGYQYNSSISSNESFAQDRRWYPNLNIGASWHYQLTNRNYITAGVSLFNISTPKQSFFDNNSVQLDRRLNFFGTSQFKLTEEIDIQPSFSAMGQGKYRELVLGSHIKYILNPAKYAHRAIYLGGWVRTGDAGFISVGMDYDDWRAGLSYDLNFSNLRPASKGRGGLEIALIYIIRGVKPNRNSYKICPDYL